MTMTFDQLELSNQDGKPIELYEFTQGDPDVLRSWFYNTSDRDLLVDIGLELPRLYLALPGIKTDGITLAGGTTDDEVTIHVPSTNEVSELFDVQPPSATVKVTMRRLHWDNLADAPIYWIGFLSSRDMPNDGEATFNCNTLIAGLAQAGLRLGYSRECPYALYDAETCKATPNYVTLTISSLTGNTIAAPELGAFGLNAFAGGVALWNVTLDGLKELRSVVSSGSGIITLLGSTYGLTVGMTIDALVGCPHSRQGCDEVHDNLPNYGGFAHMPGKSPFDGDPVF